MNARWRRDGRELFYHTFDGRFMAVPLALAGDSTLNFGVPVQLFQARQMNAGLAVGYRQQYDVTSDGQRFLLNLPVDDPTPQAIAVVANWTAALKK